MTIKRRSERVPATRAGRYGWKDVGLSNYSMPAYDKSFEYLNDSGGHPKDSAGIYREGGTMTKWKREVIQQPQYVSANSPSPNGYKIENVPFVAEYRSASGSAPSLPSINTLTALGTKAISQTTPTNPKGSGATGLVELKMDGIPSIPVLKEIQERGRRLLRAPPKSLGRALDALPWAANAYLGVAFGWAPLIRDLINFITSTRNYDALAKQLARDSGRLIRRQTTVLAERTQTSVRASSYGAPSPVMVSQAYKNPLGGYKDTDVSTVNTAWFSGAYRYFLPPPGQDLDVFGRDSRQRALDRIIYGFELTPRMIWSIMPWSWMFDWVFNINHVMNNYTNFINDGLVLEYGYLMYHSTIETTITGNIDLFDGTHLAPRTIIKDDIKMRVKAYPYGFANTVPTNLSPRQLAILAALGLSRGTK